MPGKKYSRQVFSYFYQKIDFLTFHANLETICKKPHFFFSKKLKSIRHVLNLPKSAKCYALVWFGLFPLSLHVWKGLQLVIVAFPGLFSYPFSFIITLTL